MKANIAYAHAQMWFRVQQERGEQRAMWRPVMKWLRSGSSMQGSGTPPAHKENHKEKNEETKGGGGGQ